VGEFANVQMRLLAILGLWATLNAGCTSLSVHATEGMPSGQKPVVKLAVMPFENLTGDAAASRAVTTAIVHHLRAHGSPGLMESDWPGRHDLFATAELGQRLQVDAVLMGIVTHYSYVPGAQLGGTLNPVLAVDLRLLDVRSKQIVWAAGVEATMNQLITYDGVSLMELAQVVAERVGAELGSVGVGR